MFLLHGLCSMHLSSSSALLTKMHATQCYHTAGGWPCNLHRLLCTCFASPSMKQMASRSGFMVNNSFIGSSVNEIGMTQSSWQACFQCGQALGSCTAVQGGSPYDQFSSFRSSSLANILSSAGSNCSWLGNSFMTNGSAQHPVQLVACDYPSGQLSVPARPIRHCSASFAASMQVSFVM